jgi:hypothetical protein
MKTFPQISLARSIRSEDKTFERINHGVESKTMIEIIIIYVQCFTYLILGLVRGRGLDVGMPKYP